MIKITKFGLVICFLIFAQKSLADVSLRKLLIYPTEGYSRHYYGVPYNGSFQAANGEQYDTSEFYINNKPELHLKGISAFPLTKNVFLKFNWILDFGYFSELYEASPSILSSVVLTKIENKVKYDFGLKNAFMFGGKVSEFPCVDTLSREFHCGTGLPWVDYNAVSLKPDTSAFIRITLEF